MNFILEDINNQYFNWGFYYKFKNKIKRFLDSLTVGSITYDRILAFRAFPSVYPYLNFSAYDILCFRAIVHFSHFQSQKLLKI